MVLCCKDELLVGAFNFGEMRVRVVLPYWAAFNCIFSKSIQTIFGIIWSCCIVSIYLMGKRGKTSHAWLLLKMVWFSFFSFFKEMSGALPNH
jgi:hypothetical protein